MTTMTRAAVLAAAGLALAFSAGCGSGTGKGDDLHAKGDFAGAAAEYRKAYEKSKEKDKVALVKLARALLEQHTESKEGTAAEWSETYQLLDRARQAEPLPAEVDPVKDWELANASWEAGDALAKEGKHADAVKMLKASLGHGRTGASVHETMARSLIATGDEQGAVDSLLVALEQNTDDGQLLREGAFLADGIGRKSDCHELMLVAEALKPAGFKFFTHKDIHNLVSRSYFYLTTGLLETVFTTRRLEAQRVKDWLKDEELMTKNWATYQKRPPEEVKKEEKVYFLRVLYHLYVAHGMAHVYLCDFDAARTWWENAKAIDKAKYRAPEDVAQAVLDDELGWPDHDMALLEELRKKK